MQGKVLIAAFDVLARQLATSPVYLMIFVVVGFLMVLLWVVLWRIPGRRHHCHRRRVSGHIPTALLPRRHERGLPYIRAFRFNRHRRHHRRLNPTLAQVGASPTQRGERPPAP